MNYPSVFSTRLMPDLGAKVREYADEFEIGEAAVLRLAVKEFFRNPPPRRALSSTRVHMPQKSRRRTQVIG
jgi:hypothetical protein